MRVILLNGTSSAGKTTLARAIQDESDTLFGLVPPNWGGGRDLPLSRDGFFYDRTRPPAVVVRCGDLGRRMLRSAHAAAAAFADGGDNLVIDEMLLEPDLLPHRLAALAGHEVLLVKVTCPLEVTEQRELGRRAPNGLSRGHFDAVHDHACTYDVVVDTSTATPAELARTVLAGPGYVR